MDFAAAQAVLAVAGVRVDAGLTAEEIRAVGAGVRVRVPAGPAALPFSRDAGVPQLDGLEIRRARAHPERLAWPLEGICFDIEHNVFWRPEWGPRPARLGDAFDVARRAVAEAPVLIPLCSHRYLPASPCEAGNPIFSVYQTDIIHNGCDLLDYLHNEYSYYFQRAGYAINGSPRRIRFWSRLVETTE